MEPKATKSKAAKLDDYLTLASLDAPAVAALFEKAAATKRDIEAYRAALAGRSIILLFEKPSLRTRVSFEVGGARMGAHVMYFDHSKDRIGQRETVKDLAKNLERYVDCIVARVFDHAVVEQLAEHASIPVINALSDRTHPCQGLADWFTLWERSPAPHGLKGFAVAYIGDFNNVCRSLAHGAAILGARLTVISPEGYGPSAADRAEFDRLARASGASLTVSTDPAAVKGAGAVYTDVWTSMGQDAEAAKRAKAFAPYQVNEALMARAGGNAVFMHCLPAHRGQEVTDAVIDSPNSIVYDQAENRMHAQNALYLNLLGGPPQRRGNGGKGR